MRTREEIEDWAKENPNGRIDGATLEVLLDIRDLLEEANKPVITGKDKE